MESVDRILAELKAQNVGENPDQNLVKDTVPGSSPHQLTTQGETTAQGASAQPTAQTSPAPPRGARSLDQLLNQLGEPQKRDIRAQLSQRHPPQTHQPSPLPLTKRNPSQSTEPEPPAPSQPRQDSFMLEQLKAKYQKQDVAIAAQQKQQIAQQREQVAQQRQALTQVAQKWLKQVDIRSEEGLWFEEFAYNYDSRLEAAIEYLEALDQSP